MKLIRNNIEKQRQVFFCGDRYRKVWGDSKPQEWILSHVTLLDKMMPGYVLDHGDHWIEYSVLPGIQVSELPHTTHLVKKIYKFCLANIQETYPFAHGDWALSNMLMDGDTIRMCDWDNLDQYPLAKIMQKMHSDLTSSFGTLFLQLIK